MEYIIEPRGWPVVFRDCPPGLFMFNGSLCLKTEYSDNAAYCDSGECFWGGASTLEDRSLVVVQPVDMIVRE